MGCWGRLRCFFDGLGKLDLRRILAKLLICIEFSGND